MQCDGDCFPTQYFLPHLNQAHQMLGLPSLVSERQGIQVFSCESNQHVPATKGTGHPSCELEDEKAQGSHTCAQYSCTR